LVIRPRSTRDRLSFDEARRSRPGLFVEEEVETTSWASVKVFQTKRADAVVLLGGAVKTQQAGLTAAVSGKPLACIGSFGGAARMLNKLFLGSPTWGYEDEDETKLRNCKSHSANGSSAGRSLWLDRRRPRLSLIHGRSSDRDL
jgi:hypothetical protein